MKRVFSSSVAVAILSLASIGCVTPDPAPGPLPIPELVTSVRHVGGSPYFEAAHQGELSEGEAHPFLVRVDLVALEFFPEEAFEPLADQVRMISVTRDDAPLLPASRLTSGARMGSAPSRELLREALEKEEFGRQAHLTSFIAALRPGVTAVFESIDAAASPHPHTWEPVVRRGELRIQRPWAAEQPPAEPGPDIRVVLALEDLVEPLPDDVELDEGTSRPPQPPVLQREEILLDPRSFERTDSFVIIFASPFRQGEARALAAIVDIADSRFLTKTDTLFLEEALARCDTDLKGWIPLSTLPAGSPAEFSGPGIDAALARLAVPGQTRGALLFLADATDASLTRDLALAAADIHVDVAAESLLDAIDRTSAGDSAASALDNAAGLGWLIEKTIYKLLIEYARNDAMSPELEGALIRHAGELGRHPSDLDDALDRSRGLEAFGQELLQENRLFLEDFSPAARTRAFDWLAARQNAPDGFDPLAPLKARRAALEKARDSAHAQGAGGDGR